MKMEHTHYETFVQGDSKRQPNTPRRANQIKAKAIENRNYTGNSKSYQQKSKSGRMHVPGENEYSNR